jgi:hypothetical protein
VVNSGAREEQAVDVSYKTPAMLLINTAKSGKKTFQHYQRMEFIFHNSYIILELVSSTVIFWTELRR